MATPRDLLLALARAYSLVQELPGGDPGLKKVLLDARRAQKDIGWLVVRVESRGFTVSGEPVGGAPVAGEPVGGVAVAGASVAEDPAARERAQLAQLRKAMEDAAIAELRFQEALDPEALEGFVRQLQPSVGESMGTGASRFRGVGQGLLLSFRTRKLTGEGASDRPALRGMVGSIQGLFQTERQTVPGAGNLDEGSGAEGGRPGTFSLPPDLPADLRDDILALVGASGPGRAEAANVLREWALGFREARDIQSLGRLVWALAEAGGGEADRGDLLELARELTTPAVASHVVALLGSTRKEAEQRRLIRVTALLGKEGALALADALGEARDRFQRRTYVEALEALGPVDIEMAKGMVEDSRWYVVRNGVSVLGEIGGEEAVSYVTAALANADRRVRREAVLALAKVGGENASMLLLGMVDDSEAEVRSAACRALGVLKVQRGVRPLLRVLEKDDNPGVQAECLKALGQIGDPGAVPWIEKRAVGGIFSRPSRDVRIAAYRALAAIGTPHARGLLERAARDNDEEVRAVVEGLLS